MENIGKNFESAHIAEKLSKKKFLCFFFLENNRILVKIRSTEISEIIWIPFKCLEPRAEYTVILARLSAPSRATAAPGWRELLSLGLPVTNDLTVC